MSSDDASAHAESRAILIGTSRYSDPYFPPLPAVANSLRGMAEVLTDPALCGWPAERITVWEDPTDVRKVARHLRRLGRETTGVLLVYFAGHGTIVRRGQLCMILTDTESADADISGLEFERVREALLASPARTKIVILDCCYSGRAIEALSAAVADSTETHGAYTLTASDHTAHVVAPDQQTYTATSFTGEFLTLIRTGIADGPANLTLDHLYVNLRHRLRVRGLPEPNQRSTDTVAQYVFTRNAAASPAESDTPPHQSQQRPQETKPSIEAKSWRPENKVRPLDPIASAVTSVQRRVRLHQVLLGIWILLVAAISYPIINALDAHNPKSNPNTDANPSTVTLTGHNDGVNSVAFSPDGTLASGGSDLDSGGRTLGTVRLWDVATQRNIARLNTSADSVFGVTSVAFSPNGKTLASSGTGTTQLWDMATLHPIGAPITDNTDSAITTDLVAFSPTGKILARVSGRGTVQLWDVASHHLIGAPLTGDINTDIHSMAFSANGKTLAIGYETPRMRLWDVASHHPIGAPLTGGSSVAFSPHGKTLAISRDDDNGTVWLRDVAPRHKTATLKTGSGIASMAFSPDGKTLAIGSGHCQSSDFATVPSCYGTLQLWDVATQRQTATLTGNLVTSMAFSPDGKTLAIVSTDDKTVRLWKITP